MLSRTNTRAHARTRRTHTITYTVIVCVLCVRFRFLAPCQRLRAIVCVLSAHLRGDESSTCVCLRLREQCLRSEIMSVSRVANVLLLRFVAGNVGVNTTASKRSQLIGNTAIVRKRCVIHKKSTCVCLRLSVAAFTRKRRDARFNLWPA